MRWALVRVATAVTTMVALAFLIPLGLLVWETAQDRAMNAAERQASSFGPALAITTDRTALERAVGSTEAGAAHRIAVYVPPSEGNGAATIGHARVSTEDVRAAARRGQASRVEVSGGTVLLQPVAVSNGRVAVVEVYVSREDITAGVGKTWLILSAVALGLVAISVTVADRLGTRLVAAARRLASAARSLGEGRLEVRVPVDEKNADGTPKELREAALAFNSMADRVVRLLAAERELAADLSHRLRTPLTVLRLNVASLGDGDAAEHTREAAAQLEREVDQIITTARGRGDDEPAAGRAGCDAAEVLRERTGFWSALAEDEERQWHLAGAEQPAWVPVPRAELTAVVDALLGNVFRHTPVGAAFSLDLHPAEQAVLILVSDAGPGLVSPEEALRRGQGAGGEGSTGLGLDIVRRLAEDTGGDVAVGQSVLGGAEVRLRLQTGSPAHQKQSTPTPRRGLRRGKRAGRARKRTHPEQRSDNASSAPPRA